MSEAAPIIENLKSQVRSIISGSLGITDLESLAINRFGNMKYDWKIQGRDGSFFNHQTHRWINAAFEENSEPLELSESFSGLYEIALGNIGYRFSNIDADTQLQRDKDIGFWEEKLIDAWFKIYSKLEGISVIVETIERDWADPSTKLDQIRHSEDLNALLKNVPASGAPIVPIFANYLNALESVVPFEQIEDANFSYLADARASVESPNSDNGGLILDDNPGIFVPYFHVSPNPLDIVESLKDESRAVNISTSVSTAPSFGYYDVRLVDGAEFSIAKRDFLTIEINGHDDVFDSHIATTNNEINVKLSFYGVTLVSYGPRIFDQLTSKGWLWMQPIIEAVLDAQIDNEDDRVSGFKFLIDPNIDFSRNGPFGYSMGAVISNYPRIEIEVRGSNVAEIESVFEPFETVKISFLGVDLAVEGRDSAYRKSIEADAGAGKIAMTFTPPPELIAGRGVNATAWVLGIQPNFPLADFV